MNPETCSLRRQVRQMMKLLLHYKTKAMKTIFRYLTRDKVDLIMFLVTLGFLIRFFILGDFSKSGIEEQVAEGNHSGWLFVLVGYLFYAMFRFGVFTDRIMRQDQEILKLNLQIQDNNKQIVELIQKYGLKETDKMKFTQKLNEAFTKKRKNEKSIKGTKNLPPSK